MLSHILAQFPNPYPINPSFDDDLGMLAIADIAAENPCAPFPQDRHAGAPARTRFLSGGHCAAVIALTSLARLASG